MKIKIIVVSILILIFIAGLLYATQPDTTNISEDPSWWYERPGTYTSINSATWTNCTPALNTGASIVCNKDFIYTFATSTTNADTNFDSGNVFWWSASTRREIKEFQYKSGYYLYVKCDATDEITGNTAFNTGVPTDLGVFPERVTLRTTAATHGMTAGEFVTIAGTASAYTGTFIILNVPAINTFTIYHSYDATALANTVTFDVYPAVESALIRQ